VLAPIASRFETHPEALQVFPGYEGAANLVFEFNRQNVPLILRITYSPDRPRALIEAELDYVHFLGENGVPAARPVPSVHGSLVETVQAEGIAFHAAVFHKGKGMRVPDNGYRYRTGAPIEEYFNNWARLLGQMHALSQHYTPPQTAPRRPDWFALHQQRYAIDRCVPAQYPVLRQRLHALFNEVRSLPRSPRSYGLIHGDFNDGNFTVDYSNGNMTVFDFDDSCYFWFAYELAAAWEAGVGRVMFEALPRRQAFMQAYFEEVLAGYSQENHLPDEWLIRIPLFLRLVQAEECLYFARYLDDPKSEHQPHLAYLVRCIEDELPYLGFFDPIYSPENPFTL
jgi:Ser/Thr protein kinase RdoA (MazF antagonist)